MLLTLYVQISHMQKIELKLERGNPSDIIGAANDVRRCRALLNEHRSVRLYGRSDDQYYASDEEEEHMRTQQMIQQDITVEQKNGSGSRVSLLRCATTNDDATSRHSRSSSINDAYPDNST